MSVLIGDIRYYGCADMPEGDGQTTGGAINFNVRVSFDANLISPATQWDVVSSSASDTATKIIFTGLDDNGVSHTETLSLNGQAKVTSTYSYERLLFGLTSGASSLFGLTTPGGTQAVGDVALLSHTLVITNHTAQAAANASSPNPAYIQLQSGDGASCAVGMIIQITNNTPSGAEYQLRRITAINPQSLGADYVAVDRNWGTIPTSSTTYSVGYGFHFELTGSNGGVALSGTSTQILAITQVFANTVIQGAGGSNTTYYEKFFVVNNNQTTSLVGPNLNATTFTPSIGSGVTLEMGAASSLDDTTTIANRQTAPASITFTAQPGAVSLSNGLPASSGAGSATSAQAMWLEMTVDAGVGAFETIMTMQTQGTTS